MGARAATKIQPIQPIENDNRVSGIQRRTAGMGYFARVLVCVCLGRTMTDWEFSTTTEPANQPTNIHSAHCRSAREQESRETFWLVRIQGMCSNIGTSTQTTQFAIGVRNWNRFGSVGFGHMKQRTRKRDAQCNGNKTHDKNPRSNISATRMRSTTVVGTHLNRNAGENFSRQRLLVGGGGGENRHALVLRRHAQPTGGPLRRTPLLILRHWSAGVCVCDAT